MGSSENVNVRASDSVGVYTVYRHHWAEVTATCARRDAQCFAVASVLLY